MPLPGRYGTDDSKTPENVVVTDNFTATIAVALCALNVAVMAQAYQLRASSFYSFATLSLEVLDYYQVVSLTAQGTLWLGLVGVVLSDVLGYLALRNQRRASAVLMFALLVIAGAEIAVGAILQNTLSTVHTQLYSATSSPTPTVPPSAITCANPPSTSSPTLVNASLHFTTAIFNTCCGSAGYSVENWGYHPATASGSWGSNCPLKDTSSSAPPLEADDTNQFPTPSNSYMQETCYSGGLIRYCNFCGFGPEGIYKIYGDVSHQYSFAMAPVNYQDKGSFRSCYNNIAMYSTMNYTVSENAHFICSTLQNTYIDISGYLVPGTQTQVSAFLKGTTVIPIVGPPNAPIYGCGTGLGYGLLAALLVWVIQTLTPPATALLVCGSLGATFILLGAACTCCGGGARHSETAEEAYNRYLAEVQASSHAAGNSQPNTGRYDIQASVGGSHPPTGRYDVPTATPVGDRRSMSSGYYAGYNQHPSAAYQVHDSSSEYAHSNPMNGGGAGFNVDEKI